MPKDLNINTMFLDPKELSIKRELSYHALGAILHVQAGILRVQVDLLTWNMDKRTTKRSKARSAFRSSRGDRIRGPQSFVNPRPGEKKGDPRELLLDMAP